MSNREKGVSLFIPEVNRGGGSFSSFNPNDVRKVNAIISLRSAEKVDTEQNENDFPSLCVNP